MEGSQSKKRSGQQGRRMSFRAPRHHDKIHGQMTGDCQHQKQPARLFPPVFRIIIENPGPLSLLTFVF